MFSFAAYIELLSYGMAVNVDTWPCPIPFDFDEASDPEWEPEARGAILEGLALIATQTNWQFVHRTDEPDYILFARIDAAGRASHVSRFYIDLWVSEHRAARVFYS